MVPERPLSGPNRGCGGYPRLRGYACFALGCWNEPFRLEDGLIRATRIANSATSKLALRAGTITYTVSPLELSIHRKAFENRVKWNGLTNARFVFGQTFPGQIAPFCTDSILRSDRSDFEEVDEFELLCRC